MTEHVARDKLRIDHGFLERRYDRAADVGAAEKLLELVRGSRSDALGHCLARRHWIASVVTQIGRQIEQRTEVLPEFLLERRGCEIPAVGGAIDVVTGRSSGHELATGLRPLTCHSAVAHPPVHERKQIV